MRQYSVIWYIAVMNGIVIVAASKYWIILNNLLSELFRCFRMHISFFSINQL